MQEGTGRGADAGEWLRVHFAGDPEPEISIQWAEGEMQPGAYDRLLEILFAPRPGDLAA